MFKVIVAYDWNRGIGKDNKLPWYIREDIEYFKKLSTETNNKNKKNVVIMGRKTYESIPQKFRPLSDRINIVLSKTMEQSENIENLVILDSIDKVLKYIHKNKKIIESSYVIGGQSIYEQFFSMNLVSDIYATEIKYRYECDAFFPKVNGYKKVDDIQHLYSTDHKIEYNVGFDFCHYIYENKEENNYLKLMKNILKNGIEKGDRTGTGTRSLFAQSLKYDIRDGRLPLLTTKLVPFRLIVEELLWFLKGNTNAKDLEKKRVNIWKGNTTREFLDNRGLGHLPIGDIGAGYGFQLRHFNGEYKTCNDDYTGEGFDQLEYVIDLLKNNPTSRRILFSYWNPSQLNDAALPPCHLLYQFYVNPKTNELSCCLYQRSSDYFLANNYNAVSAIVLVNMLCVICGYVPGDFTHFMGDTHIYNNHIEQCKEQLLRRPTIPPKLEVNKEIKSINDFKYEHFKLINYFPQKSIRGKMN